MQKGEGKKKENDKTEIVFCAAKKGFRWLEEAGKDVNLEESENFSQQTFLIRTEQ